MNNISRIGTYGCHLFLICFLIFLSGCAGNRQPLSQDDRLLINAVAIEPDDILYEDSEALITLLPGMASVRCKNTSGAIEEVAKKNLYGQLLAQFKNDNMLRKTISESFKYQINESNLFNIVGKDKADTVLQVEVFTIQIQNVRGFSGSGCRLTAMYKAKLISKKDNRIMWKSGAYVNPMFEKVIEYPLQDYFSNPSKLQYAISVVSQMLAADIVKQLGGTAVTANHKLHQVQDTLETKEGITCP